MRDVETYSINGRDIVTTYNQNDFPYHKLLNATSSGKGKYSYSCTYGTFDIETSSTRINGVPIAWMYHWQACVGGYVILGRRWEEYFLFLRKLNAVLELDECKKMVMYVHNLGYEFSFLKTFFQWENIFTRSKRQIMRAVDNQGMEYRCSYLLSNKGLEDFCKEENVIHRKVKNVFDEENGFAEYDYDKIRTPDTPITPDEDAYHVNDVLGLYEAITSRLEHDNLHTIPMTSTGYVRRDLRNACFSIPGYRQKLVDCRLSLPLYYEMKEAFRGGDTAANPMYVGEIIEDGDSYDISSSYPYTIMCCKFPMSPFRQITYEHFQDVYDSGKFAMIFRFHVKRINKRTPGGIAYIPLAKTRKRKNVISANGRIFSADELEITITDIDYRIIEETYEWEDYTISDIYISKYDYLPKPIRATTREYYYFKSTLKDIDNKEYTKSKNKLNSIYGCMVTDILHPDYIYENNEIIEKMSKEPLDILDIHYSSKKLFLSYQWGVWVTAHARYRLYEGRKLIGEDGVIYNDTDSIKCFRGEGKVLEDLNKEIIYNYKNVDVEPYVLYNGKYYYMGILDKEEPWKKFRTWGAKKYCYITEDNTLHFTVSGVSKKRGCEVLQNDIEKFEPGLIIENCGNLTGYYNTELPHEITVDGCAFLTGSNLALFKSSYELGITNEYKEFLKNL